ncbi:MAG: non-canonical purine NTP pyrophosphatase, partial [Corynebacterium variabile]|nr:non-canonical purine NTP pyrophosphatase [Corynebacterium variabile]
MAVQVLVASRNRKKLGELERVLAAAGIEGIELLTLR